eukprot:12714-Heterococcus_DN1.PRE.5
MPLCNQHSAACITPVKSSAEICKREEIAIMQQLGRKKICRKSLKNMPKLSLSSRCVCVSYAHATSYDATACRTAVKCSHAQGKLCDALNKTRLYDSTTHGTQLAPYALAAGTSTCDNSSCSTTTALLLHAELHLHCRCCSKTEASSSSSSTATGDYTNSLHQQLQSTA